MRSGRRVFGLALAAVLAGTPAPARAASSSVRTTFVRYEGDPSRNGFEWATFSVRYALHACGGELMISTEYVRGSFDFSAGYWFEGKLHEMPAGLRPDADQGTFAGDVVRPGGARVGSFTETAGIQTGHGCLGVTVKVADLDAFLGDKPDAAQVKRFLDGLAVSARALPPFRDVHVESALRQRIERERREAERKEAEEKAAAERKVAEEKAAAEKTARKEAEERAAAARAAAESDDSRDAAGEGAESGENSERDRGDAGHSGTASGSDGFAAVETDGVDEGSTASPSHREPTGADRWAEYLEREREREEQSKAQEEQLAQGFSALGNAMAESMARDAEREYAAWAANYEKWQAICGKRKTQEIERPVYHVPPGRHFTLESLYCWDGQYYEGSTVWTDSYAFTIERAEELRFIVGGLKKVEVVLWRVGQDERLGKGEDFTVQLQPGRHTLTVRWEGGGDEPPMDRYFLRILPKQACWTDAATVVPRGRTRLDPGQHGCLGPDGRRSAIYRFEADDQGLSRNVSLEVSAPGAQPRLQLLGGEEGRRLKLEYGRTPDSATVKVEPAGPEPLFVLVSAEQPDAAPMDLLLLSKKVPYPVGFRGHFTLDVTWMYEHSEFQGLWNGINVGGHLGAQVSPSLGVTAVAEALVGGGVRLEQSGGPRLFLAGLLGLGFHLGQVDQFVSITPAVSAFRRAGEDSIGPALRVDYTSTLGNGGSFALSQGLEIHRHGGINNYVVTTGFSTVMSRDPRPVDDW